MDSAANCMATWDRSRCRDIRKCNVGIKSADDDAYFVCTEVGTVTIAVLNKKTGRCRRLTVRNVLISPKFPFHIIVRDRAIRAEVHCVQVEGGELMAILQLQEQPTAACMRRMQRLLRSNTCHHVNSKLYFFDENEQQHSVETATIAAARARVRAAGCRRPLFDPCASGTCFEYVRP